MYAKFTTRSQNADALHNCPLFIDRKRDNYPDDKYLYNRNSLIATNLL